MKTLDFYDSSTSILTATDCHAANIDSNVWRHEKCYEPRTLNRAQGSEGANNFHPERPEMFILARDAGQL